MFRYRPGVPATTLPAARRFGGTTRRDAWWVQSALTFLGLSAFIVYSTWAALQNAHYEFGPYLSPIFSPLLFGTSPHAWFGGPDIPTWWPAALPYTAAVWILWAPGGFRFTCYYYRGAYYKAFWADPPACAVGEPRKQLSRRTVDAAGPAERPSLLSVPARSSFSSSCAYDVFLATPRFRRRAAARQFGIGRRHADSRG